ncbi:MAG: alpha/beta hydrolase, partial [Cellulomonadaceae bacterium]|nr:alpha/beta hydrolase [Cellulomonadaceae bacterium]
MRSTTFDNAGITMAGNLYLPDDFDESRSYPAIVSVHPGGGVKEQTAGEYAARLAAQGYVTLAFDASHQGESGGEPRFLDVPTNRVGDTFSAIDFLTTLDYVDNDRIGVLGICAGGGIAIKASSLDRRVKAVATVAGIDVGATFRLGWDGTGTVADQLAALEGIGAIRTAMANGADPVYGTYVPEVGDTSAPRDMQEAAEYYLTPRAQHPNTPNTLLLTSVNHVIGFNAFSEASTLLTQPLLIVAGSEAGSLWQSVLLDELAAGPHEFIVLDGETHV